MKYHSAEMGDMPSESSTAIPQLAAWKLYGVPAGFLLNLSDFVKFLVSY